MTSLSGATPSHFQGAPRNEEVVEFLDHLKLSSFHIKAKIGEMMDEYRRIGEDSENGMVQLEKRIALQVVLNWIEDHEVTE